MTVEPRSLRIVHAAQRFAQTCHKRKAKAIQSSVVAYVTMALSFGYEKPQLTALSDEEQIAAWDAYKRTYQWAVASGGAR